MRVFVLGGAGKVGRVVVERLAGTDLVAQIAVAGRNVDRAATLAQSIGAKGTAVGVDGSDAQALARRLEGYDLLVNCTYEDTQRDAIQAAIRAGAHYCDVLGEPDDADALASEVAAAGTTVVVANGICPGLVNLMGVHGARHLDQVRQLQKAQAGMFDFFSTREMGSRDWLEDPNKSRAALPQFRGFLTFMFGQMKRDGTRLMLDHRQGQWVEAQPITDGVDVPQVGGGTLRSYPFISCGPFWQGVPTDLSEAPPVEMWFSTLPARPDAVLREQALRMLDQDLDPEAAVTAFFDIVDRDPHRWPTGPGDYSPVPIAWLRAVGTKEGRPARYDCWLTPALGAVGGWGLTSLSVTAAALLLLRGKVDGPGLTTAEKAFPFEPFLAELAGLLPEPLPVGQLAEESLQWLDERAGPVPA